MTRGADKTAPGKSLKEQRLAEALRRNLRRRKAPRVADAETPEETRQD
jgi:hypothetical protein